MQTHSGQRLSRLSTRSAQRWAHTHSHTHTHTLTHTHTHYLARIRAITLSLSLSLFLSLTHSLSLSFSLSHSIFLTFSLSLSLHCIPDRVLLSRSLRADPVRQVDRIASQALCAPEEDRLRFIHCTQRAGSWPFPPRVCNPGAFAERGDMVERESVCVCV